jgi:hypothetical protein
MLASFGERSAHSKKPGQFTPYFLYKIENYQSDYYLYFPSEPFPLRYKNEIFNKLQEYTGHDRTRYLEFHYGAYSDKTGFLNFLNYEIFERLKRQPKDPGLLTAQEWVAKRMEELKKEQQEQIKKEVEQSVQEIVNQQLTASPQEIEHQVSLLVNKFTGHMDRVAAETERGIKDLTDYLSTGRIELNNQIHEDKVIQALILLQTMQAPTKQAKAGPLFKRFTNADLAAVLRLHFAAFKDNTISTLQKKITEQSERTKSDSPKLKKLEDALQEFFY